MRMALLTALLRLGIEKGMQRKSCPGILKLHLGAGVCVAVGALFLLFALHRQLQISFGYVSANVLFGIGFMVVAGGLLLTVSIRRYRFEQQPQPGALEQLQDAAQPFLQNAKQAGGKIRQGIAQHNGKIMLGVLVAGMLLGRKQAKDHFDKRQ